MPDAHPGAHIFLAVESTLAWIILGFWAGGLLVLVHQGRTPGGFLRGTSSQNQDDRAILEVPEKCSWTLTICSLAMATALSSLSLLAIFAGPGKVSFETPIISSRNRFCLCSGVSFHAELLSSATLGAFAPLPVLNPRARCFVGSMRAAKSSCFGGIVIQSSRRSFSGAELGGLDRVWAVLSAEAVDAAVVEGSAGPKSSSSSLSGFTAFAKGSAGRSSSGAGGIAGPMTFLLFSPSPGLPIRFAPEAVGGSYFLLSSCCRFLLASRCGGRSGPIADIVFGAVGRM